MDVWKVSAHVLKNNKIFLPVLYQYRPAFTSKQNANRTVAETAGAVKPYTDIPVCKTSSFEMIKLILTDQLKNSHLFQYDRLLETGPILVQQVAKFYNMLFIMDTTASKVFVRKVGQMTRRMPIDCWEEYTKSKGENPGLFSLQGDEWRHVRRVVEKPLLQMKYMDGFTDQLNPITKELIDHLAAARNEEGTVEKLDSHFFNWALESIAFLLYQRRFGCIDGTSDELSKKFIESVSVVFTLTMKIVFLPPRFVKWFFPFTWKRFTDCWDTFFLMGRKCLKDLESSDKECILTDMLKQKKLSEGEIVSSITALMIGAVDTTSNTILWTLYELARWPDVQEKLLKEINKEIPRGELPSYENIKHMPFLKAVVRETLRIHPPVNAVSRITDNDIDILGYHVPAGTIISVFSYGTSRSEDVFDSPEEFRPDRWLRENRTNSLDAFCSMPFGFGARMCPGRRIAELEMYLAVSQLIRRFEIILTDEEPLKGKQRLLIVPEKQVPVSFKDRCEA